MSEIAEIQAQTEVDAAMVADVASGVKSIRSGKPREEKPVAKAEADTGKEDAPASPPASQDYEAELSQKQLDALKAAKITPATLGKLSSEERKEFVERITEQRSSHDRAMSQLGKMLQKAKENGIEVADEAEDGAEGDQPGDDDLEAITADDLENYDPALTKLVKNQQKVLALQKKENADLRKELGQIKEAIDGQSRTARQAEIDGFYSELHPDAFGSILGTGPTATLPNKSQATTRKNIEGQADAKVAAMQKAGTPITWADAMERVLRSDYAKPFAEHERLLFREKNETRRRGAPELPSARRAPQRSADPDDGMVDFVAAGIKKARNG